MPPENATTMIKITFPDNAVREFELGSSAFQIAQSISEGLARNIIAAKVNGRIREIDFPITSDAKIELLSWESQDGKQAFWHSTAHILAQALLDIYPGAKLAIGPSIENGFYYDVDLEGRSISENDFQKIEQKMLEFAREKAVFKMREISKAEALDFYKKEGNKYKIELIENLEDGDITFCDHSNFTDLCRGGHIPNTGLIKAVKLMSIAGAYWRGNENNPQLTRIYGVSFPKQKMLEEYLVLLEEAKKRDHRKLGKELGLFTFSKKVGQGLPMWLPKGAALRERLENFLKKAQKTAGYQQVITPHIGQKELYVCSGHYEKYGKDSFQPIQTPAEDEEFLLKPMNCPHHCELFADSPKSYKDLPIRFAEFGTVYRYEQSGELHGLTRVRGFTQDDAHIFCTAEQVKSEFQKVIKLVLYIFKTLDFQEYTAQISLRDKNNPTKYIGSDKNWEMAESAIIEACNEMGLNTTTVEGEAAFYGPKLDFMIKDALGRSWQLGTIQVDYNLPERFELEYTGADNHKHRPVMIHRAPFGSMERFVAVLTEHCEGKFPIWLNPEQVAILTISEKYNDKAKEIAQLLNNSDIRAFVDERGEKIGKKIRETELKKVPYMVIVGEKEAESGLLSIRKQGSGDLGTMTVPEFVKHIEMEIEALLGKGFEN